MPLPGQAGAEVRVTLALPEPVGPPEPLRPSLILPIPFTKIHFNIAKPDRL